MNHGDGERLAREYFRLIEEILKSRRVSGRQVSRQIERSESYFSHVKRSGAVEKTWRVVEEGLQISPRTLFAVLAEDVDYDQILAAFGPQDEPQKKEFVARLEELEDLVLTSPACRRGGVSGEVWKTLEDLERRRFKDAPQVAAECAARVRDASAKQDLARDEAVVAVGALGVWSTIRRHANDRGSATQGLVLAIRVSFVLGVEKLSARLLQRAAYLLCDVDQFRPAELVSEKALRLYSDIGDLEGIGMAMIDTGFVAFAARHLERAEARLLAGAGLLGGSSLNHINKASAYQLAAKACSIGGHLDRACKHLEEAERYAASYKLHWAAIRWCFGNIQFQLGRPEEAEPALHEALQVYIRSDKITDVIMILLDLATLLIAQERIDEIPPLADYLGPYLERLSEKDQIRSHLEDARACLLRAKHVQALKRFKKEYSEARQRGFAAP